MESETNVSQLGTLSEDYKEALIASGLVDDVVDIDGFELHPYRYAEGEYICRHGDAADRLWVIVSGAVAVKEQGTTLFIRGASEVVGEQHIVGNGYRRIYDLVAAENSVEVLSISKVQIENHPEAEAIWRNVARIISTKLRSASKKVTSLSRQLSDDTRILHAYTNEYALQRRFMCGSKHQADYKVEKAIFWFSDVDGFSEHTSILAPDRMADLVQRFFNAQSLPIVSHGGHVDKFMGDGMMAFWVMPRQESSAEKECLEALRAAEESVRAVSSISVGRTPLSLRIGLHLGAAVSGDFGSATRHQFTMVGSDVNKAARLEQLHSGDVYEGSRKLGAIRLSKEFFDCLSAPVQKRYQQSSLARVKGVKDLEVRSLSASLD